MPDNNWDQTVVIPELRKKVMPIVEECSRTHNYRSGDAILVILHYVHQYGLRNFFFTIRHLIETLQIIDQPEWGGYKGRVHELIGGLRTMGYIEAIGVEGSVALRLTYKGVKFINM